MKIAKVLNPWDRYALMSLVAATSCAGGSLLERGTHLAWASACADPGSGVTILAAEDDGYLGVAVLSPKRKGCSVRLESLYVVRPARGRGVGSALVREAIKLHPHLQLACSPDLKAYYQRLGFVKWRAAMACTDLIGGTTKKAHRGYVAIAPTREHFMDCMERLEAMDGWMEAFSD
ncbi:GNAT family N-acetyltransferase [Halomonas sp. RA08-2]|uniref:GNAT family N-acetyltransferase n=1 Tax=Halomonas sp. RA08-2 TaxID=3440842 RepID=UPI003EEA9698